MYSKGGKTLNTKMSLAAARINAGLTQTEMAKKLGVSLPTYCGYERGKSIMRVDKAEMFSDIVKIPQGNIIFFKNKLH